VGLLLLQCEAAGAALPGQLPHDLPVGATEVGVGLQPANSALLLLAQLELGVGGAVGLLARHQRRGPIGRGRLSPPGQAKHPPARPLVIIAGGELLKGLVGLGPAGTGPRQLPGPVPWRLVQQGAEPVAFGPQLFGRQPPQLWGAGRVDRQRLPTTAGQRLGELVVAVADLAVRQVQFGRSLGFGPTTEYNRVSWRAPDSCTYSQLLSSAPVSRTSARHLVRPWARWPVVA
jgi:hypothetical protein